MYAYRIVGWGWDEAVGAFRLTCQIEWTRFVLLFRRLLWLTAHCVACRSVKIPRVRGLVVVFMIVSSSCALTNGHEFN